MFERILPQRDADGNPIWEGGLPQHEIDSLLYEVRQTFTKFNRWLIQKATDNSAYIPAIWDKCFNNGDDGIIFWFDAFVYTHFVHAPPDYPDPHVKMVTYPYQERWLRWVHRRITARKNGLTDKSRDVGLTWLFTGYTCWDWLRDKNANYLIGSYKEALVDGKSADAIMPKFDYIAERMAFFLKDEEYDTSNKHFCTFLMRKNPTTKCEVKGEATSKNFGRGGRKRAAFMDEYPQWGIAEQARQSAGKTCQSIIFVGTPDGRGNDFGRLRFNHGDDTDFVFTIHWTEHPEYQSGRYRCAAGCEWHKTPGQPHSLRYDKICRDKYNCNPRMIASEMDIDYAGSGGNVFNMDVVGACIERIEQSPTAKQHVQLEWQKNVDVHLTSPDRMEWFKAARKWDVSPVVRSAGGLVVWRPPFDCRNTKCACEGTGAHTYVIGGDTARNVGGGDFGAIGVLDLTRGMLVARWKGKVDTDEYADIAARMAKWYGECSGGDRNPWVGVEWNDVGVNANDYLNKMGLRLIITQTWDRIHKRWENKLGIVTSPTTKPQLIDRYLYPFVSKKDDKGYPVLFVPDIEFWRQCEVFITHESSQGKVRPDKPKMGAAIGEHDDMVMMLAFCCFTAMNKHGRVKGHVRERALSHWRENANAVRTRDRMLESYYRQAKLLDRSAATPHKPNDHIPRRVS